MGTLAEGLGSRAVARVFEVDPQTVLAWLMEGADHAAAFSRYCGPDVGVTPVLLDELSALLRAVKADEVSEPQARKRLSRSPHGVWAAIAPVSQRLRTIEVGDRPLAVAPWLVHQGVQGLAPDCGPRFLTDGFKEDMTALLAHEGHWVPPSRRRARGAAPTPRWLPRPHLL